MASGVGVPLTPPALPATKRRQPIAEQRKPPESIANQLESPSGATDK